MWVRQFRRAGVQAGEKEYGGAGGRVGSAVRAHPKRRVLVSGHDVGFTLLVPDEGRSCTVDENANLV